MDLTNPSNNRYYIRDALGHTRLLLDSTGVVKDTYIYDAWGNLLQGSELNTPNPFTWNGAYGYEWLEFTGLYHVGAREYDPRTARWLQRDPIGVGGGHPNVYLYCGNDPVNSSDPSGLQDEDDWLIDGLGLNPDGSRYNNLPRAKRARQVAGAAKETLATSLGLTPGIGLVEAKYGRDCSGRQLGAGERTVAAVGAVAPGGGGFLAKGRQLIGRGIRWLGRLIGIGRGASGQIHHVLSNKILVGLNNHPTLKGHFNREDFKVQATTSADHCGYQTWHRQYDDAVMKWLKDNRSATRDQFVQFLRDLYSSKDMRKRFPEALKVIK